MPANLLSSISTSANSFLMSRRTSAWFLPVNFAISRLDTNPTPSLSFKRRPHCRHEIGVSKVKAQKPRKRYFFAYRSAFHYVGLGKAVAIRAGFFYAGTPTLSSPAPSSMAPVYIIQKWSNRNGRTTDRTSEP